MINNNRRLDYKIECWTPKDFNLFIKVQADPKLVKKIWKYRKNQMLRKKGIKVKDANLESIQEFKVPPVYFKYLNLVSKKLVSGCSNIFKKDGIVLLNHEVEEATYKLNDNKGWDIEIKYKGLYTKENV